jgi:SAM-dependent methyltransferase
MSQISDNQKEASGYIHGTHEEEQGRLSLLNRLTNPPFLNFLALRPTDTVLEVGSGLGLLASEVAARVPQGAVYGVEFSAEQLSQVPAGVPTLHFVRGDAHTLPFPDATFDVVYCRYVLEHVPDPLTVLREMRRVLKPGGRALAQENDDAMFTFDPDCPCVAALWEKFIALQFRLGGDPLIGRRLFRLFYHAGFRDISLSLQPEIHAAGQQSFLMWVENAIGLFNGASESLQAHGLATADEIAEAIAELQLHMKREDASALFHWNRAVGVKPEPSL